MWYAQRKSRLYYYNLLKGILFAVLVVNNILADTTYNTAASDIKDDINAPIKSSLLSTDSDKLTPSPHEHLNLYTGTLKLSYVDFSTPIAPGLNLEVIRSYDSTVYNYVNYPQKGSVKYYDYNLPSWNISTSYIFERLGDSCRFADDPCDLILTHTNGDTEALRNPDNKSGIWISKNGSVLDGKTNILIDRRGFKYFFDKHSLPVNGGIRHYLSRVETPDSKHWLSYSYNGGHYLKSIESSDPNKKIEINIEPAVWAENTAMTELTGVTFNGKRIVNYAYDYIKEHGPLYGRIALISVSKANGEVTKYGYKFLNIKVSDKVNYEYHWRLMLNHVVYPNGESSRYYYTDDSELYEGMFLKNIRIGKIEHETNYKFNRYETRSTWTINQKLINNYNGAKVKQVTVEGPYHNTRTIFSHASNELAWRAGLPLEHYVYQGKNNADATILKKESYSWGKRLFSDQYYYLSSSFKMFGFDTKTYKPRLKSKKIQIYNTDGIDSYQQQVNSYDEYDNPTDITLMGHDGSVKHIQQSYYNNKDRNILGLPTNIAINGHNVLQQQYDDYGRVVNAQKFNKKFKYTYSNGFLATETDGNNKTTSYSNYKGTVPGLIANADGTISTKQVNLDGTIKSETDENGNTSQYEYNADKQLIKVQPTSGLPTVYSYDFNNIFSKYTELGNYQSTEEYNHAGLLIHKNENNDKNKYIEYDSLGRKIFESYVYRTSESKRYNGHYYTYDSLNRLVSDCYPSANENCVTTQYWANNTVKVAAPTGEYKIFSYGIFEPGASNLQKIVEDARTTEIKRDSLDRVISVTQADSKNRVTKSYYYDNKYNLVKYIEPETGVTEYQYDNVGNVIQKSQNGKKTSYKFKPNTYRVEKKLYSDNSQDEYFEYDNTGNVIKTRKGQIERIYQYNKNNQLVKEGLILLEKYKNTPQELYVYYKYNPKGELSSIIYPDETIINLNPDKYGRATTLENYIGNIQYHANNQWKSYIQDNSIAASTVLDNFNRVAQYQYGSLVLAYLYDVNNNLSSLSLNDSSNKDYHYNLFFNYDLQGRLVGAQGPWGNKVYAYDGLDNLLSIKTLNNGFQNNQMDLFYQNLRLISFEQNKKKEKFNYDSFGNITQDGKSNYEYGLDGNLLFSKGKSSNQYQYDANGHRVVKQENNNITISFYTKSGDLLFEYNPQENKSVKYLYLHGHKVVKIENILSSKDKNTKKPKVEYYYNDAIGSPVAMADSNGKTLWHQVYEPYGATYFNKNNNQSKNNKHWFAGKEVDNTSLSYFGARYYNASTARFTSPDPVSVNPELPNTFNRYVYANNNPYKYVDPDGRIAWLLVGLGLTAYETYGAYQAGGIESASKHLVRNGALTIATGGAIRLASKALPVAKYAYYMRKVEKLDVSTKRNGAVFYSGPGNRQLAEEFALANNKTTLEMTRGGSWLDKKYLFDQVNKPNTMDREQVAEVWKRLSQRFAEEASGTAVGFAKGARMDSIFNTVESPALSRNNNITNVITGGY